MPKRVRLKLTELDSSSDQYRICKTLSEITFHKLCKNDATKLSQQDFITYCQSNCGNVSKESCTYVFKCIDLNNNGTISVVEFNIFKDED